MQSKNIVKKKKYVYKITNTFTFIFESGMSVSRLSFKHNINFKQIHIIHEN